MKTYLVPLVPRVIVEHFRGLCGSRRCHVAGPHTHEICPACGALWTYETANIACARCRQRYPHLDRAYTLASIPTYCDLTERLEKYEREPGRCNRGHVTLPLKLWDCPECTESLRRELAGARAMIEELRLILSLRLCTCRHGYNPDPAAHAEGEPITRVGQCQYLRALNDYFSSPIEAR